MNFILELKQSIKIALPLIASEVIVALSVFIATIMVAHLGEEQLAANALVWEIYIAVVVFFINILCSVSIMVSQSFGAKDNHSISICFKQGLIMAVAFAPLMMLAMWLAPIVLVWTGQDPVIIQIAKPFFQALIWPMLPLNIVFAIEQFLIGINKTKTVMLVGILTVPIEIFFFYAFLFGNFGFPNSGLTGIGYGLTASYCLIAVILFCCIHFFSDLAKYNLFKKWWLINNKFLFELTRVGIPLGFMYAADFALFAVVAIMMGILGTTTLAAYQIANQYLMLSLAFIFALAQTITVRIGNEVGKNNISALKLSALVNLAISLGFMLLFSIFYIFFPKIAIGLDLNVNIQDNYSQNLIKEASVFLELVGIMIIVDCLRMISIGALRGLKDTKIPMFISIIIFWCIALPLAYLLAFKFGFGGIGIWWGIIIGLFITGIMLFIRFVRLVKNNINLLSIVTKA